MSRKTLRICGAIAPSVLATLGLAACGGADVERAPAPTPEPPSLAGVYAGKLPCSNCVAIDASLWLREDRRFLLRQIYETADESVDEPAPKAAYALGLWRWDETAARLVLDGAGPDRRLALLEAGRLQLQTASPVPHILTRATAPPPFADRLPLEGMSEIVEGGATFTECLTGLSFDVAPEADFAELRRLHRRLNRNGPPALTAVEAHFAQAFGLGGAGVETLVIDRVLAVKPRESC
jgi:hypothetical protein